MQARSRVHNNCTVLEKLPELAAKHILRSTEERRKQNKGLVNVQFRMEVMSRATMANIIAT